MLIEGSDSRFESLNGMRKAGWCEEYKEAKQKA
jgi:hypothetical protein